MNVGFVVANFDHAEGTGGYAVELVRRIAARHQVTLYASRVRTAPPEGVTIVPVPALKSRGYATILSFPAAFSAVRRPHDLVHAQGWVTGNADVVTAHIVLGGWRAAASRAGLWPGLGERVFGPLVEQLEARLYRRARAVIAPSRKARDDLARLYGRTGGVSVIPHGFSGPENGDRASARRRFGCPADDFVALYAGDPRKGLVAAMDAVAQHSDVHLLVAGHADHASYRAHAERLGLGTRAHWVGGLPGLGEAYAAADVLLHPTIYDSFGLIVAEAMAAGVPAIVSRAAGVAELITDRASGWLLGEDPVSEGAAALGALRHDASLRDRLAAGARAVAATRSWDIVASETMATYESVT